MDEVIKIKLKTSVYMPEIPPEIEIESGTLHDVLLKVLSGLHFAKEIIDRNTGKLNLDDLFQVKLNDVNYQSLPGGLNTELRDGDTITFSLILLGGG